MINCAYCIAYLIPVSMIVFNFLCSKYYEVIAKNVKLYDFSISEVKNTHIANDGFTRAATIGEPAVVTTVTCGDLDL